MLRLFNRNSQRLPCSTCYDPDILYYFRIRIHQFIHICSPVSDTLDLTLCQNLPNLVTKRPSWPSSLNTPIHTTYIILFSEYFSFHPLTNHTFPYISTLPPACPFINIHLKNYHNHRYRNLFNTLSYLATNVITCYNP